jgi:TonB family protein
MMALFMSYTLATTILAALSAHLIEKCRISLTRPVRAVWLAAILFAVLAPVAVLATSYLESRDDSFGPTSVVSAAVQSANLGTPPVQSAGAIFSPQAGAVVRLIDPVLGWVWATASLAFAAILALFRLRARRLVRGASRSSIGGTPVLLTDDVGPAIVGATRYEILLPRWVLDLPESQTELIVAHERQHARAFDPLLLWLAAGTIVLFPWNGGLWYMMRRLRTSIEFDCDRRVLDSAPDPHAYMTLLVDMVERVSLPPAFAAALTESSSQLHRRIVAMTTAPSAASRIRVLSLAAAGCVILAGAARIPSPASPLPHRKAAVAQSRDSVTRAYFEYEVSEPVTQVPGTGTLIYPAALRAANVQGEVIAEFVVDVEGKPEPETLRFERSSNDLFAAAVTEALPRMRFTPAKLGGKNVKQVVQQAFLFRLDVEAPQAPRTVVVQDRRMENRLIQDSAMAMAKRLEPAAFDPKRNPGSSLIGILFDANGRAIHHSRITVAHDEENWRVLYPRLFPDAAKADRAPYQLMAWLDRTPGERSVGLVAVWLKDPRKK